MSMSNEARSIELKEEHLQKIRGKSVKQLADYWQMARAKWHSAEKKDKPYIEKLLDEILKEKDRAAAQEYQLKEGKPMEQTPEEDS